MTRYLRCEVKRVERRLALGTVHILCHMVMLGGTRYKTGDRLLKEWMSRTMIGEVTTGWFILCSRCYSSEIG